MAPPRICPKQRLLDRTDRSGDCWIWLGATTRDGYGVMGIGRNKQHRAHRVSFEVFKGAIPEGMVVCHTCDTPRCVNPDHLFVGTVSDNTQDMLRKGRHPIRRDGEHHATKISHADRELVRAARARGETLTTIASRFGVSFQIISAICNRSGSYGAA
jgi:hypothetical protein